MAKMIPARYVGPQEVVLSKFGGPYVDAEGNRLVDLRLRAGSTLMMSEEEIKGCTWLLDPAALVDPRYLGVGRVVLDQDVGLSDQELLAKGYRFHQGRSDFEEIVAAPMELPAKKGAKKEE